ncbi:hypothetical protein [Hafnia alvei]|uniref:Uncharacterized protein n=1 Tax=Hafnia alvei ATCC 51873 TaxID=1002364 RepID=G9Y0G2_HAFAL|nr:hypothetical protein [Hafnia alvei]EHM48841.1 hypothetical protein HMPREF0454_00020 [Hafnia alvei ATCC 51873]QQE44211.1 hypothetical protein I6H95_02515 [Hafnia alvei]
MNFYQIIQTMTDDAYDIVSALNKTESLTPQAIAYITGQREHATRFILEQMAAYDMANEINGQWCLSERFKDSVYKSMA